MHFDFYLCLKLTNRVIFKGTLDNGFKGNYFFFFFWVRGFDFLQNEPLPSFIDSLFFLLISLLFLISVPYFFLLVLVLLLLSAGFPSLLRHQTWALLRSVERALGSTNRITGVARAGVYGVCLHWPGPGEGWVTLRWDFLLSFMLLLFLSLRFPPLSVPPGYYDLSASSSHTLPVYLWVHPIWFFTSCLGKKVLRTSACMSGVCVYVFKLQSCRMHSYNEPYWD